jgi:hypothetical protein
MYFRSFRARSATEVNTPRDNVALDLGKPQFHLIEPGRIRGREMEADSGMLLQKLLHRFGFVGGEIVQHDVNLSCPARFPQQPPQKHQELRAGISLRSVALHPAGLHVQGGIQRQSSVPVVLETVPFGSPRRQREHGIEPIQFWNPDSRFLRTSLCSFNHAFRGSRNVCRSRRSARQKISSYRAVLASRQERLGRIAAQICHRIVVMNVAGTEHA